MMKTVFNKTKVAATLVTLGALASFMAANTAFAQADSTTGNGALRGNPQINRKYLDIPPVPAPIVNNNTYINQTVGLAGRVFRFGGGGGYASCPAGSTIISGGGYCREQIEFSGLINTNTWQVICNSGGAGDNMFAVCVSD